MMTTETVSRPRRRWVWWLAGIFGGSALVLVAGVASYITLDRDAAALRGAVTRAAGLRVATRVQTSLGEGSLDMIRFGVEWVNDLPPEARSALKAVRSASVGVYEVKGRNSNEGRELWTAADATMGRRGWSRMIAVRDTEQTVLVYADDAVPQAPTMRLCLAVLNERELVVVSTRIVATELERLVTEAAGRKDLKFDRAGVGALAHIRL